MDRRLLTPQGLIAYARKLLREVSRYYRNLSRTTKVRPCDVIRALKLIYREPYGQIWEPLRCM